MVKQKKKRTKKYTGAGATTPTPPAIRIQAVQRSKAGQWWFEKKKFARPLLIAAAVIFVLVFVITELLRIIF